MPEINNATTVMALAKKKIPDAELELLKVIPKATVVDVIVPSDIEADKFRMMMRAVLSTYVLSAWKQQVLFPVVGKLMVTAKAHPEFWSSKYDDFTAFTVATAETYGVSKSTLLEAKNMVERWGDVLTMQEFNQIGRVRMKRISAAVLKGAEKENASEKLREVASSGTAEELDDYLESNYHRSPTDDIGAYLKFPCSKKQEKQITKFMKDARVHAVVGSDKPGDIFEAMVQECGVEWLDRGAQIIASQPEKSSDEAA